MSARKRRSPVMEGESSSTSNSKRVRSPELDMYQDCVNHMFDPSRVLLRRVFFLDPEKTKYISVGFYPSRNYQPLVEIGSPKSIPLILTDLLWLNICQLSVKFCVVTNTTKCWTVTSKYPRHQLTSQQWSRSAIRSQEIYKLKTFWNTSSFIHFLHDSKSTHEVQGSHVWCY